MKKQKYVYGMMAAATLLAASCTDFDDYNEVKYDDPTEGQSLWENIKANGNLSDFANVLEKVGFASELGNSTSYTVWAPQNGTFNADSLLQVINDKGAAEVLKKFVKSHVANYSYPLTSTVDQSVVALNEKTYDLKGTTGAYSYDGKSIVTPNMPSSNGLVHILNGSADFFSNIYEHLSEASDIDSIRNYYMKYEQQYLDTEKSVEGEVDDQGRQTYSDSVMVTRNTMTSTLRQSLADEDSTSLMVVPTNEAYAKAYEKIKPLFKFAASTHYATVNSTGIGSDLTYTFDTAYLQDSLTRKAIATNLVMSKSNAYNKWLFDASEVSLADTVYTTQRNKLSNGTAFTKQFAVGSPVKMSNGYMQIVDSLAYLSWETYLPEVEAPIFSTSSRYATQSKLSSVSIASTKLNTEKGQDIYRYLNVEPNSNSSQPKFNVSVPGLRAATYNVYVVFIPEDISTDYVLTEDTLKSVKVAVTMTYAGSDGKLLTDKALTAVDNGHLVESDGVVSNKTIVDTCCVGQITLPVSYAANSTVAPYISLAVKYSKYTKNKIYSNHLRLGGIFFRPVEYDEYLKKTTVSYDHE